MNLKDWQRDAFIRFDLDRFKIESQELLKLRDHKEGSPPQGLSEARRGREVLFISRWNRRGGAPSGAAALSLLGVWGHQPRFMIHRLMCILAFCKYRA